MSAEPEINMAMAPSSSLSTSDPPRAAEPVVKDSLSYWEKQSATYDGVLGVYDQFSQFTQGLTRS
jgi:hypothetical protein